jgi:hypothetical protein
MSQIAPSRRGHQAQFSVGSGLRRLPHLCTISPPVTPDGGAKPQGLIVFRLSFAVAVNTGSAAECETSIVTCSGLTIQRRALLS